MNARDDLGFFDADTLHDAMRVMWEAAGRATDRPWTRMDLAAAECEAPEPAQHPRYDDPDHAAMHHYRDEVSSA
jgi:hypothetical protein